MEGRTRVQVSTFGYASSDASGGDSCHQILCHTDSLPHGIVAVASPRALLRQSCSPSCDLHHVPSQTNLHLLQNVSAGLLHTPPPPSASSDVAHGMIFCNESDQAGSVTEVESWDEEEDMSDEEEWEYPYPSQGKLF